MPTQLRSMSRLLPYPWITVLPGHGRRAYLGSLEHRAAAMQHLLEEHGMGNLATELGAAHDPSSQEAGASGTSSKVGADTTMTTAYTTTTTITTLAGLLIVRNKLATQLLAHNLSRPSCTRWLP